MNTPESHALRAVIRTLVVFCLTFCAGTVCAGETVLKEDFEKLDLKSLPQGWRVITAEEIAIVQEGASKVLRINHKGEGIAELNIPIDAKQVRGRKMLVTVKMKVPAGYTPVREKQGMPQLVTIIESGGRRRVLYGGPPPTARGWVRMRSPLQVPADTSSLTIGLRVKWVACEAFYDDLTITVEGQPATAVAGGTTPGPNASKSPSTGTAKSTAALGINVSRHHVQDHGARMGPQVVAAMRALRRPGATAKTFVVIGAAAPLKELGKASPVPAWTQLTPPSELTGVKATPEALFLKLPTFLSTKKPEVVLFACGGSEAEERTYKERYDWDDLARLCLRFGALPVLAVPPEKAECPSRVEILEAVRLSNLPAVEVSPLDGGERVSLAKGSVPAPFPHRVAWLIRNLEEHVCGRKPAKDPAQSTGNEDEEE
jgi:hypothetical protein